ncbi:MAG: molybdopterin-dependent oxidoreductase [Deltaproteobacteria bacterium]|nr:molybdopterin-dependent oxidoreductase [Deltaproteobacteria bacterium]
MFKVTIDGKKVEVPRGTTILEAARMLDVDIPTFCDYKHLMPFGSCRMCVVEVEGSDRLFASCVVPVADGMDIHTDTARVRRARETILELLLTYHPLECPICPQSGRCRLQDMTFEHGKDYGRFGYIKVEKRIDYLSPLIEMNQNRCILCGRCVRICDEVQGEGELDFTNRGFPTVVEPSFARMLDCEFCGQCIQACPVGALYSRIYKYTAPSWELTPVRTTCPFCGVGCTLNLEVKGDRIYHVLGVDDEGSINSGFLCCKGRFGYEYVHHPDRITEPRVRKDGELVTATWDEAYEYIVNGLTRIRDEKGADALGGIASARCTNEENYLFQKFMRAAVGTNNVDSIARFAHFPGMEALRKAFGVEAPTNTLNDLTHSDLIFTLDSNITEDDHVAGLKVIKQVRSGNAGLLVANSRKVKIARFADSWMRHSPGTSVALLNSMAFTIFDEGLEDKRFCEKRVTGVEELRTSLQDYAPEKMKDVTGVPSEQVREAARLLAAAGHATIIITLGAASPYTGEDTVAAAVNLALITGNVGRLGAGVIPMSEYNNVQGSMDMGALCEFFPGYQPVADEGIREWFEGQWKTTLSAKDGLSAEGMILAALKGRLKGLYIMGENPLSSFPDRETVKKALKKLDLLVVQDMFLTDTALLADVVLPTSCGPEKDGTFTNTDRRVQRVRKAIKSKGHTRDDWKIIAELSTLFGYPMDFTNGMDITEEIAHVIPFYAGIKPERLEKNGLHWPCPRTDHPGTEVLHMDRFPSGLGRARPVTYQEPKKATANYPYILIPGTLLYHSGTTTTMAKGLNEVAPAAVAEVNPKDAETLEIKTGDWIRLTGMKGITEVQAKVTDRSMPGTIFVPTHYRDVHVNALFEYNAVKEKGITCVAVEKTERIVVEERDVGGQLTKIKKTVQEIQKKRLQASNETGPEVSGG